MIIDHRQLVRDYLPQNGFGLDIGCRNTDGKIGKFGCDIARGVGVNLVCDGATLSFKDNSLDYISACHVLEHILNPKLTLIEWTRALKVNGSLFIVVPNAEKDLRKGVMYWEHVTWFTPFILKTLVRNWLKFNIFHFETREDLHSGPMIFCYSTKPENFSLPRLPKI